MNDGADQFAARIDYEAASIGQFECPDRADSVAHKSLLFTIDGLRQLVADAIRRYTAENDDS